MWEKIKSYIKKWWVAILAILAAIFFAGRKPKWVKEKEKEIKERDEEIEQAEDDLSDIWDEYEEVKADHDEEIKRIRKEREAYADPISFDNVNDAADYLRDVIRRKSQP